MNPLDRLPPHSMEAEQGLLGSLILDVHAASDAFAKVDAESFYDLRNADVFTLLAEMFDAREPVNSMTVLQRLKDRQKLDSIGGLDYLTLLMEASPSAHNASYYAEIVAEKATLRNIVRTCAEVTQRVYEANSGDLALELLDELESKVLSACRVQKESGEKTMKEYIREAIGDIEAMHERQGRPFGLTTGFPDLDRLTRGLQPGVYIIAARPSIGKTALALNIVEHVAVECGLPVGVFSLEMTGKSLSTRLICSKSRISLSAVSDGILEERDFMKMTLASTALIPAPIHICEDSGITILQLKARARRMAQRHGVKLIVIDYLQLIESPRRHGESREQQVSAISRAIKQLSMELNLPVILLAQLNREIEKDKNRKPRLSDLRESGSIEQDADAVGLLYRRNVEGDDEDSNQTPVGFILAKQRNGATGEIFLTFMKSHTRFESVSRLEV